MRYHFEFCIPNGANDVDLTLPTAPMYIDAKTYSGRCKMWLKSARMPLTTSSVLVGGLGDINPMIEFSTPSQNRYYLTTGSADGLADTASGAIFEIPVDGKSFVMDESRKMNVYDGYLANMNRAGTQTAAYPFYQNVNTNGGGVVAIRNTKVLIARTFGAGGASGGAVDVTADAQDAEIITTAPFGSAGVSNGLSAVAAIFPVGQHANEGGRPAADRYRFGISATDTSGGALGMSLAYHNELMDDRDCLIIGAPWGSRINAKIKLSSLENALALDNTQIVGGMVGVARFEIVIEPMKNEHDPFYAV